MNDANSLDALFRDAVAAMDAGDVARVERLTRENPRLVHERLKHPGAWLRDKVGGALDGFFKHPYLLWFVAEDPVRNDTLPANIAQVAASIIDAARRENVDSLREQLDYALSLVAWSWVADRCGVQLPLIDVLVDAGASMDGAPENALVNGHTAAAEHFVQRGAKLTLATALCIGRWQDVRALAEKASQRDKQFALTLAALNGKADGLVRLVPYGVDVSAPSRDLYAHATPLHHAVSSGSLDAVRVLVEAGANLGAKDKVHRSTPLGWAEHFVSEPRTYDPPRQYSEIANYLRGKNDERA
jgi:peptide-methionine (S)-S-oxide reductase